MIKETFDKFSALIRGLNDDAVKDAFLNFQKSLGYCIEENNVMREVLRDKYNCKQLQLNDEQKKRLATRAINLNKHILEDIIKIFQPETVLGWYRDLVGQKYDRTGGPNAAKRGPKMVSSEIIAEVLKLARRNPRSARKFMMGVFYLKNQTESIYFSESGSGIKMLEKRCIFRLNSF